MDSPTPVSSTVNGIEHVPAILTFLNGIGIKTRFQKIETKTFVPGLLIENGVLLIDREKLLYPGDLLHEAGHIAVVPSAERDTLSDVTGDGNEIVAILWSYAAIKAIGLPEELVFHEEGYKGDSKWLIESFESENYIGLPLLEWMGFTADKQKAKLLGVPAFPHMLRWLRE